jgi:FlaG/FlaF family flagellin (archaellin)
MTSSGLAGERGTAPLTGVVVLLVITVLVAAAVGTGVFLNQDSVDATVEIAVGQTEATVLWTEQGSADRIVVTTADAQGNVTIESVNGTARVPGDIGTARRSTTIIVRAVNNESSTILEERTVDLS